MKIDVYTICWNEADMLEFFFRHYDRLASRYVIYDDGSTDGSLEILKRHPKVEIRPFVRTVEGSYVLSAMDFHNTAWKESRGKADWVLITAIDEHLMHADLHAYLQKCLETGVTLVPALGYQMVSRRFPKPSEDLREVATHGAPFTQMSKLCLFRPDSIEETNFSAGRHSALPTGNIVFPTNDEVLNLHFKYVGFQRLADRHRMLATGLGPEDTEKGFGHRYQFTETELAKDWDEFERAAIRVYGREALAAQTYQEHRWWREQQSDSAIVRLLRRIFRR